MILYASNAPCVGQLTADYNCTRLGYIQRVQSQPADMAAVPEALSYPFDAVPQPGEVLAVAPGVLWMRMRLPMPALNHINVWALEDEGGWTLVDTGMQTPHTAEAWQQRSSLDRWRRADRARHRAPTCIPITSAWPAGSPASSDCRLWITRLEYLMCRMLVADTGREAPADGVRFYRAAGWDEAALDNYTARFGGFGKAVHALPDSYRRVVDGEELTHRRARVAGGRRPRATRRSTRACTARS